MKRKHLANLTAAGILILFLLSLGFQIQPASAASFAVNDSGDQGDAAPGNGACATSTHKCTLRAAIEETNALPGPNTITIPSMTIVLGAELRILDHVGDDSVIIQGAGQNSTILDGNGRTRVFYFEARSGNHAISNLTIRNARNTNTSTTERNGGGIFNEAVLSLSSVTVTGSSAYQGGGIYNQHAFSNPTLGENVPSLTLRSVTLTNNSATGAEIGYGGGGLFNGSQLDGDHVTVTGNTAALQGGGFYNNSYKTAQLTNFVIRDNTSRDGGGIDNDLGQLTLTNGVISGNISNCCRPPNNASTGGGGIYNNSGVLKLTNVDLSSNHATSPGGYGGAIYNATHLELTNVSITRNQAAYGAGIYNGNYDGAANFMSMFNATISSNVGVSAAQVDAEGGGIFNGNNGHTYIYNSTIAQNSAAVGGGITNRSTNTQVEIHNTILAGNTDNWGATDCRGTILSGLYNLVGNPFGNPAHFPCVFNAGTGDQIQVNPMLGALTGSPAYHPLMSSSPAIDHGTMNECPSVDVRGVARPLGSTCDLGAYEAAPRVYSHRFFLPMATR